LVRQPKTAVLGWNQSTNISYPGSQSVKLIYLFLTLNLTIIINSQHIGYLSGQPPLAKCMSHRLRNAYLSGQSRGISLCACADGVKSTSLQVRNSLDTGARVVLTSETAVGYMHVTCATCAKMKSSCGGLFWEKRALLGKHCFRIW